MVSQTVLVLAEFRLNEHLYEQFICDVKGTNQHLQLNRQVLLCLFCLQMCLYCPALFLTLFFPPSFLCSINTTFLQQGGMWSLSWPSCSSAQDSTSAGILWSSVRISNERYLLSHEAVIVQIDFLEMSRNFCSFSGKKAHLNWNISCARGSHRTHELPWGGWSDYFFALHQVQIAVHVGFGFRLLHILLLSLPSPKDIENSSASCFIYKFLWFCALSAWVGGRSSVLWIFNRKAENSSPQNVTLMVCNVSGTILLSVR